MADQQDWTPGDFASMVANPFCAIDIDEGLALPHQPLTERLQHSIHAGGAPAIVTRAGRRSLVLSDYDYLRDDAAAANTRFEEHAAAEADQT